MEREPGKDAALGALDRLQISVRERKVDVTRWALDLKAERRAAPRQFDSKAR